VNNRRLIYIILGLVAIIAAATWLYFEWTGHRADANPPAAAGATANSRELHFPKDAPQLSFIKVEKAMAMPEPLLDPLSARIAYDENHTARVSSPVTGRVTHIAAQPGDRVTAGQTLVLLDSPDFASAVADVAKSASDLQQKQKSFARANELYRAEVIARKDFELSESGLNQAEAEDNRAKQRLRNLDPALKGTDGTYALRAPISGIVAERNVNPGAEVRPDAPNPLFIVTDSSHLWVIVDVPERNIGSVHVGQEVVVEVDAYPNERFPARIVSIGEVLDPATRRVQVRCALDNPKRLLKPEMYARVTPLAGTENKLPRIPNSALITEGLYSFVFIEKQPGVFVKRKVTLGLQGRSVTYVKEGLTDGDRVVSIGALLLNAQLGGDK
jgi:cobalt-zinc-cadmium efflux system membrane fusion protein